MTIYEIKEKTQTTEPYFFTRNAMKFFHQKMADFKVKKQIDGRYLISAPMKDYTGKVVGYTERYFNPENNKLEFS